MMRESKVKEIVLNGVKIEVLTHAQLQEFHIKKTDTLWKAGSKYLYVEGMNWRDLYRAAGYDSNKLDMAYPARWRDADPKVDARFRAGDHASWYYGGKHKMLGEPVWTSEVKKKIIMMAKRKM